MVRTAIVRRALVIVTLGLVAGVVVGTAVARVVASQLLNVQPLDPWTIAAEAGILIVVAWAAALVPARQASATNPADALRA